MDYVTAHPQNCQCMQGVNSITTLQTANGAESCILHHNLSSLNARYEAMYRQRSERQRILQLPSLQPLLVRIGINQGSFN